MRGSSASTLTPLFPNGLFSYLLTYLENCINLLHRKSRGVLLVAMVSYPPEAGGFESTPHKNRRHQSIGVAFLFSRKTGQYINMKGKILSENRRARFDYEILETYEAGIELTGQEVKSVKGGGFNLNSAHVILKNNEAWLLNSQIPPYQPKNAPENYDPERTRRLLLHSTEIKSLTGRLHEKGLTLIPLNSHLKKNLIKLDLGLGRSRKKQDKRELLKKRAAQKEIREK